VMKPARGTMDWNDRVGQKAVRVFDATHLLEIWVLAAPTYPVLVQEWVEGGDDHLYSFNGYFDASGQPLATFIARKVRQWPPHTGMSSLGGERREDRGRPTPVCPPSEWSAATTWSSRPRSGSSRPSRTAGSPTSR